MDGRTIEPRHVMWAVAEISWADPEGTPNQARATIVDMSLSGACIRLKSPVRLGARLTVKWHREQFSAIARNCRRDGVEFLLGVRRDAEAAEAAEAAAKQAASGVSDVAKGGVHSMAFDVAVKDVASNVSTARVSDHPAPVRAPALSPVLPPAAKPVRVAPLQAEGQSARRERKAMPGKTLFPQFWRRQPDPDAPTKPTPTEAPVNKTNDHAAETDPSPQNELLSYEDIYHAAGIMNPRSGYGIQKVVEMMNSERIRELSNDVKRASVLMALEAAGASVDELLQDATRRQQALNSYEEGQRKRLDEFESRKTQENARIQAEMERLAAHYAERIQRNRDQIAHEKEALRNWQMAKQHESQRIGEVTELCAKPKPASAAMAAAAGQEAGTAVPVVSRREP